MSTRSQIMFKFDDGIENKTRYLLTYKHSDGYPKGVIPLLQEYHKWCGRKDDFSYYTASWFYFVKRKTEEIRNTENPLKGGRKTTVQLGHGIDEDYILRGDIVHFYLVDLNSETIYHYSDNIRDEKNVWELIKKEPTKIYSLREEPGKGGF